MEWNYEGRLFRVLENSTGGETSNETTFLYHQRNNVLWGTYEGGDMKMGMLVGVVSSLGEPDFDYKHVNVFGAICSGVCRSVPEILARGKIRLLEKWRWMTGDLSEGASVIEECTS